MSDSSRERNKFVQIAAIPSDGQTHPVGIFALDESGTVWHYEGQRGWIPLTDKRGEEPKP